MKGEKILFFASFFMIAVSFGVLITSITNFEKVETQTAVIVNLTAEENGLPEKLADNLAKDFGIRGSLRDTIIYADFNPDTGETRYCEDSQEAANIVYKTGNPNAVVNAIAVNDPENGHYMIFGENILGDKDMMDEGVIHELAHIYCWQKGISQGSDDHNRSYEKVHDMIRKKAEVSYNVKEANYDIR